MALERILVVTACTVWDNLQTGETLILEHNQTLWFGEKMDHSLVSPHQVRSFGITIICDDPYDPQNKVGMKDPYSGNKIPFGLLLLTIYSKWLWVGYHSLVSNKKLGRLY